MAFVLVTTKDSPQGGTKETLVVDTKVNASFTLLPYEALAPGLISI